MRVATGVRWACVMLFALLFVSCSRTKEDRQILVSAAADLRPAFSELGRLFEAESGTQVVFNFGSSGQLAQQIIGGADVDVFASANLRYVEEVERSGLMLAGTKALYARGYLAIWWPPGSPLSISRIEQLADPSIRRIAIANPRHAPYGVAAREALTRAGILSAVSSRLVFGENVAHALQFAATGNAEVAIIGLSLCLQSGGHFLRVPSTLHEPLDQALGVISTTRHPREARELAAFITGPKGRKVMAKYGFTSPGHAAKDGRRQVHHGAQP